MKGWKEREKGLKQRTKLKIFNWYLKETLNSLKSLVSGTNKQREINLRHREREDICREKIKRRYL